MLRQIASLPRLQQVVAQAASAHAADPDYMSELSACSGRYDSADGVPTDNIPPSDPAAPIPGRVGAQTRQRSVVGGALGKGSHRPDRDGLSAARRMTFCPARDVIGRG